MLCAANFPLYHAVTPHTSLLHSNTTRSHIFWIWNSTTATLWQRRKRNQQVNLLLILDSMLSAIDHKLFSSCPLTCAVSLSLSLSPSLYLYLVLFEPKPIIIIYLKNLLELIGLVTNWRGAKKHFTTTLHSMGTSVNEITTVVMVGWLLWRQRGECKHKTTIKSCIIFHASY